MYVFVSVCVCVCACARAHIVHTFAHYKHVCVRGYVSAGCACTHLRANASMCNACICMKSKSFICTPAALGQSDQRLSPCVLGSYAMCVTDGSPVAPPTIPYSRENLHYTHT